MSEELIKSVQEMLNEEKWTRVTIANYTKSNFIELGAKIEAAKNENCIDEVKAICDEYLVHTKNSIIALYLSGMLGLKQRSLDNSAIVDLVTIFIDNKKTQIVEYLCEKILEEDETNKFALRTIAECYKEDNSDKVWEIYDKIFRLDREEADIAKLLAEHYKEQIVKEDGTVDLEIKEKTVDYYKEALLRFVAKKENSHIKEVWSELINLIPEEIDFFYLVQRKIAKTISEDKSATLMRDLYEEYYKPKGDWDTSIDILKLLLQIDERDQWARKEIVECYRNKYEGHSQFEECLSISSLASGPRNVFEAIADFEKHIAFDKDNYVFHRSWGVGRISSVSNDVVVIDFGKKIGEKEMTLKMAIDALQPLAKNHIWVLKATKKRETLAARVLDGEKGAIWTLKTIIKSFDNNCDFKRIKEELVGNAKITEKKGAVTAKAADQKPTGILTPEEWTRWSAKARKILDENPIFGVNPNDISMYTVRGKAITPEEKLSNEFKAQKEFFKRIDILMKFEKTADVESSLFTEMFNYFLGFLKAFSSVNEQTIASFLVVRRISTEHPNLAQPMKYTFEQLFNEIENPQKMYEALKDTSNTNLKDDYLFCIHHLLPNWNEVYIKLFPTVLKQKLLDDLIEAGYKEDVKKLVVHSFENYKDYREASIFFFKESQDEEWFKELNISLEKQIIRMIHIDELTYKEIENHCNTTENKKIQKQIETLIFKDEKIQKFILESGLETTTRIFTLIEDVKGIDPAEKNKMRNKILEKYPDFKLPTIKEEETAIQGLIVTQKMYTEKQMLLEQITSVELPAIAKEIGEAAEKGDLKENAEFIAAKEKQKQLNHQASKLQAEIGKAQRFDPTTITTARISFGTVATLKDTASGEEISYTILGPWESDPENKIISYMSPLGGKLLGGKEGETLKFKINDKNYSYKVVKIAAAKF